jgi:Tol biopolymer transport system component
LAARLSTIWTLVLASLVLAAPAHAAFPGTNGKIAFSTYGQVYTINADGTGETVLASGRDPAWSADGTKLAYVNPAGHLAVMNADGSGQTDLGVAPQPGYEFSDLWNPSWSPDGTKIVYENDEETIDDLQTREIYVVSGVIPNGPKTRLPFCDFCVAQDPSWSPDGGWIAAHVTDPDTGAISIKKIRPDGTGLTDVYSGPSDSPDWAPNGFRLAVSEGQGRPSSAIAAVNSDGTGYVTLDQPASNVYDDQPAWSPDQQRIAFVQTDYSASPAAQHRLYVMNADGSGKTLLLSDPSVSYRAPSWQPIPYTGYPRPRGASPFRASLVPAFKQCTAPNDSHGSPLAFGSCNPPQQESSYLTVGTPDANGAGAHSIGFVLFKVVPASFNGELRITSTITDVRCMPATDAAVCNSPNATDGPDYSGDLQANMTIRITDHYNGSNVNEAATVRDIPFPLRAVCTNTADTSTGGVCTVTTACLLPEGCSTAGRRTVIEMGQLEVSDGGADGNAGTADNTVFMRQGVFVP